MRYLTSALVAGAALALTATATSAQTATSAPLDRNNLRTIVCQDYPAATGSRIGHRVICLTNAQWDEVHRQAREGLEMELKKSYSMKT